MFFSLIVSFSPNYSSTSVFSFCSQFFFFYSASCLNVFEKVFPFDLCRCWILRTISGRGCYASSHKVLTSKQYCHCFFFGYLPVPITFSVTLLTTCCSIFSMDLPTTSLRCNTPRSLLLCFAAHFPGRRAIEMRLRINFGQDLFLPKWRFSNRDFSTRRTNKLAQSWFEWPCRLYNIEWACVTRLHTLYL